MNCKDGVEGSPELQKAIAEQRDLRETIAEQRETIEYLEREIERMQKTIDDEFG